MQAPAHISIRIEGTRNGEPLNPLAVDITEVKAIINDFESFLFPSRQEKAARPKIAYQLEEGSAVHKFFTTLTAVITFGAIVGEIAARQSIDFLDYKQRKIIDRFQRMAATDNFSITFSTSTQDAPVLTITPDSRYYDAAPTWIQTEFYLYGEIYEEGGINPNLHIETKEYGRLTVAATKAELQEGENRLYQVRGIKASGKQNLADGRPFDLVLESFIAYNPVFDQSMLDALIAKARPNLSKIKDVDAWLNELRGGSAAYG